MYTYGYQTNKGINFAVITTRTAPGNLTKTYAYDSTAGSYSSTTGQIGLLTSITDEAGVVTGRYYYDKLGRATTTQGGTIGTSPANAYSIAYATDANTVTLPNGAIERNVFATISGFPRVVSKTVTHSSISLLPSSQSFDLDGNLIAANNSDGTTSCWQYDSGGRGLLVRTIEGLPSGTGCVAALGSTSIAAPAKVTTLQWDSQLRIPVGISGPKAIQILEYDAQGRIIRKTTTGTSDESGAQGFAAQAVGASKIEAYSYNSFGQVLTYTSPAGGETTYTYDTAGNLVSSQNPLQQVTTYSMYDAAGRVGQVTTPAGQVTTLAYDAAGHVTAVSTGGLTTSFAYLANGLLSSQTTSEGESLTYTYDLANRLSKVQDQRGNTRNLVLNNAGGATSDTVKNSAGTAVLATSRTFDALNRVTQMSGAHFVSPQPASYTP